MSIAPFKFGPSGKASFNYGQLQLASFE